MKVLTWQGDEHEEPAHHSSRRGNEALDQDSAYKNQGKEALQKDNRDYRQFLTAFKQQDVLGSENIYNHFQIMNEVNCI